MKTIKKQIWIAIVSKDEADYKKKLKERMREVWDCDWGIV